MRFRRSAAVAISVACVAMGWGCGPRWPADKPPDLSGRPFDVKQYGAVGDGVARDTLAVQRAVDAAAQAGGGTVVVPRGTFLCGAVFMKPTVNLRIEREGVLLGSPTIGDYPRVPTRIEGHTENWVPAIINATDCDHLRIEGEGTIRGGGQVYWTAFREAHAKDRSTKNLDVPRPRMIFVEGSRDVRIGGVKLVDSGFWNIHLYRCRGVVIDGVDIRARSTQPGGTPSTDGIDVDSSQDVTIQNCRIAVGDDCIALKGAKGVRAMEDKSSPPVEHIRIRKCVFEAGGGIATCGSEATVVRDVVVEDCVIRGAGARAVTLLELKLRTDTPQVYEDIHVRNIRLEEGGGRLFRVEPWSQYEKLEGMGRPKHVVRNVSVSGVRGEGGSFGVIAPGKGDEVEILVEDVDVKVARGGMPRVPDGVTLKNVRIVGGGE